MNANINTFISIYVIVAITVPLFYGLDGNYTLASVTGS